MKQVAVIGLGYFSQFHLTAWRHQPGVQLAAVADMDLAHARAVGAELGVPAYASAEQLLQDHAPDIIDLVVPPQAHAALLPTLMRQGRLVICQKPFCSTLSEAETVTDLAENTKTHLIIHENFRFQPWYREARAFLDSGRMGQVFGARFALRPGDGRGPNAYLERQPSFQKMRRFLVQETAVHLVDVFRWLFGPVSSVYADLRQLNPVITGEDAGILILDHESGATSVFDGNRLADHVARNPRTTMGEMVIEGEGGSLSLDGDGRLWFRAFGEQAAEQVPITYPVDSGQFGGGCVAALIAAAVEDEAAGRPFENTARDYLTVLRICEAAYRSSSEQRRIAL